MDNNNLIENPDWIQKPHVVLLGAGASLSAFPHGDANENILPLMANIVDVIGLAKIFKNAGLDVTQNFETIYPTLKKDMKQAVEDKILTYFSDLKLPSKATLYDKILLSLRGKDAVFTFNWDPFLYDAYERNKEICALPNIFFLHGNVRIGWCNNCYQLGQTNQECSACSNVYKNVPLLYPIEKKDYFKSHEYTKSCWEKAKDFFAVL